jgi:hypothetical protein
LIDEDKASRVKEVELGEKAALQLAMEERRRVLAEEKNTRDRECKDAEFAHQLIDTEAKEHAHIVELCSGDDELARRIEAMLHDEMLAEEIQRQEMLADQKIREQRAQLEQDDAELARREDELHSKKEALERAQQLENDSMEAKLMQEIEDANAAIERKKMELKDATLSQRMQIQASRQDHRQQRKAEMISSGKRDAVIHNADALIRQWEECDADCEDVAGGICLTLFLPNLRDIKVNIIGKSILDVHASRALLASESKSRVRADSYNAEYSIRGPDIQVDTKDVSFEYSSETGLLFVYVEKVQMNYDPSDSNNNYNMTTGTAATSVKSQSRTAVAKASIVNNGKMMVGAVRNGFHGLSKMFASGKSSRK